MSREFKKAKHPIAGLAIAVGLLAACSKNNASRTASPPAAADVAKVETPVTPVDMPSNAETNPDLPGANEGVSVPGNIAGAGFDPDKGAVYLIKNLNSLKCMTVEDGSTANGGETEQYTCEEGNAFQKFKITESEPGSGFYSIMNLGSYKVLELRDKQTVNGTVIQQNDFFGADNQLFEIRADRDNSERIRSKSGDVWIDVKNRNIFDGADIHIWEYRDQNNQLWLFLPTL